MDISNSSLERVFTYRTRSDTPAEGASARLGRIIGAVVSGGERLSFQPPSSQPNTSYALQVYVPLMQCNPANATLEDLIVKIVSETSGADSPAVGFPGNSPLDKETFHWRHNWADGKLQAEGDIGYFAVVPYYESNNLTFWWNSTQSRTISTDRFLGQIWIAIAEYPNNQTRMQFVSCGLYNASVSFKVNFTNHVPSISNIQKRWLNAANLYQPASDNDILNSYSAYFQGICSYLFGSVAWYNDGLWIAKVFASQRNNEYQFNKVITMV